MSCLFSGGNASGRQLFLAEIIKDINAVPAKSLFKNTC
jgi:hypothetical protein